MCRRSVAPELGNVRKCEKLAKGAVRKAGRERKRKKEIAELRIRLKSYTRSSAGSFNSERGIRSRKEGEDDEGRGWGHGDPGDYRGAHSPVCVGGSFRHDSSRRTLSVGRVAHWLASVF